MVPFYMAQMSANIYELLLQLVRLGIGTSEDEIIHEDVDWVQLKSVADSQGLSAVALDGLNKVLKSSTQLLTLNSQLKLLWIGEVVQNYEARYHQYEKAIGSLAGFYNRHGYRIMVLKGYTCSLNWPNPEHRPCGDIDIWQFGQYKNADAALIREFGIKIDKSHHHHTVFQWQGFSVENHYDFVNVHHHRSHRKLEKILKRLGRDDSHCVEVNRERVCLPSPNLHALFLIKHAALHFVSSELTIRHMLDWAFFVQEHGHEINWSWLESILEEFGLKNIFNVFNAICVEELGFDVHIFPQIQNNPDMKNRVLNDILTREFSEKTPKYLWRRIPFKYRRWKANEWKHKLCYRESMWSSFWSGAWSHLLKPKSI